MQALYQRQHTRGGYPQQDRALILNTDYQYDSTHAFRVFEDAVANTVAQAKQNKQNNPQAKGGTTFSGVALTGNRIDTANVGDSEIHVFRVNKKTGRVTEHTPLFYEDSLVADQVRNGVLTPEQAHGHPRANIITNNVNDKFTTAQEDRTKGVHRYTKTFDDLSPDEEVVVLNISDGASKTVSMAEMQAIIGKAVKRGQIEAIPTMIGNLADSRGESDDITIAVDKLTPHDSKTRFSLVADGNGDIGHQVAQALMTNLTQMVSQSRDVTQNAFQANQRLAQRQQQMMSQKIQPLHQKLANGLGQALGNGMKSVMVAKDGGLILRVANNFSRQAITNSFGIEKGSIGVFTNTDGTVRRDRDGNHLLYLNKEQAQNVSSQLGVDYKKIAPTPFITQVIDAVFKANESLQDYAKTAVETVRTTFRDMFYKEARVNAISQAGTILVDTNHGSLTTEMNHLAATYAQAGYQVSNRGDRISISHPSLKNQSTRLGDIMDEVKGILQEMGIQTSHKVAGAVR